MQKTEEVVINLPLGGKPNKKMMVPFGAFAGANSTKEQWKVLPLDISLAAH